jgi:branched-chain amino acid aminotransferase
MAVGYTDPMPPSVYFNGRFLPAEQATLSLDDLGFTQGVTVTDRLRTFRQQIFRLDDHLRRFRQSCGLAYVPQPRPDAELADAARELVEMNAAAAGPEVEFAVGLFATPGADEPTLGIQVAPLAFGRYRHYFAPGAVLEPLPLAVPPALLDPWIKHRSRLGWWVARNELRSRPGGDPHAEPLLTTPAPGQFVRETTIANFLAEIGGVLVSPPRTQILNGISLDVTRELCAGLGIPFAEREMTLDEVIAGAGECLLTNTSFCLGSVARLGGREFAAGGPLFQRLLRAWDDLLGLDVRAQFLR